jgi:exonuclease III
VFDPIFLHLTFIITCYHILIINICDSLLAVGGTNIAKTPHALLMDSKNNKYSKILFWNVRGIDSQEKWDALRDKISESACQVLCIQETKRETFDSFYTKKLCPRYLDEFASSPSIVASGGFLIVWNSSVFYGNVVQSNSYAITVKLLCRLDNKNFHVTNIYGPPCSQQKIGFDT